MKWAMTTVLKKPSSTSKHRNVCYEFLGRLYLEHIVVWEDQEQAGTLDTQLPPALEDVNEKGGLLAPQDVGDNQDPLLFNLFFFL